MLARYAAQAGITSSMSPHKWRHFLFTWLKKEGIDDVLIQPYSGHATRQSLEVYSRLSPFRCSTLLQSSNGTLPKTVEEQGNAFALYALYSRYFAAGNTFRSATLYTCFPPG
jgi:hypothetical protein